MKNLDYAMKNDLKNILTNKNYLFILNLVLWLALAFVLPWQTKLILRPALSNYWEISLFLVMPICFSLLIIHLILNIRSLKRIILPKILTISFSLFLISMVMIFFLALDPILSWYHYFWILLFLITLTSFHKLKKKCQLYILLALLISLLIQAGIGIFQFLGQKSFASTFLGMSFHDVSQAGVSVIETASGRYLRAYGSLDHPNVFGGLMSIAAIVSAYLYARRDNKYWRLFAIFSYSIFNLALLASFSRASILAFFLGMLFFLLENRQKLRRIIILALVSLLIIISFSFRYHELVFSRFERSNRLETISINERAVYNKLAWESFKEKPILGSGLANSTLDLYQTDRQNDQEKAIWNYQPAHNYWLLLLTEGGIILFSSFLLFYIFAYQKSRSNRLLGIFICFFILTLFDHWLLSLPLASVLPLFWIIFI